MSSNKKPWSFSRKTKPLWDEGGSFSPALVFTSFPTWDPSSRLAPKDRVSRLWGLPAPNCSSHEHQQLKEGEEEQEQQGQSHTAPPGPPGKQSPLLLPGPVGTKGSPSSQVQAGCSQLGSLQGMQQRETGQGQSPAAGASLKWSQTRTVLGYALWRS